MKNIRHHSGSIVASLLTGLLIVFVVKTMIAIKADLITATLGGLLGGSCGMLFIVRIKDDIDTCVRELEEMERTIEQIED